jgi:hypothetical protein
VPKCAAAHETHVYIKLLWFVVVPREVLSMLENTLEVLEQLAPLLDDGDTDSAGKLLVPLDRTSLRALLIHIVRKRGVPVADVVAAAYLRATANRVEQPKAA